MRGRSVSYLRRWAGEEGQQEAESKQTNKQPGGHAALLAQLPPWRGSRARPRHPSGEGGMRRMCRELAAARSPRAAVPGAGRHPSRGAAWQWETGARLRISFPLLETELRKHQARGGGVKSAMPVRQAMEMDLAAGPGAKGTCPGYRTDQRGHRDRLPVGAARPVPASRGHLLRAGSSLCLVVGSICSCTESRGEGGEQREKAQLVDEQREACRKPSPQITRNR